MSDSKKIRILTEVFFYRICIKRDNGDRRDAYICCDDVNAPLAAVLNLADEMAIDHEYIAGIEELGMGCYIEALDDGSWETDAGKMSRLVPFEITLNDD